jgi:dipeptidyl aminopeptidase/acylaminoacyl peptidase
MNRSDLPLVFCHESQTRHALVLLRGEIRHKDLYEVDLDTGRERALTNVGPDFTITDFDISPDGRTVLLERSQENSNIVLLKLRGQP